jgi:lysine 2,3-aminomutase
MSKPRYLTKLDQIPQLTKTEKRRLQPVSERFVFRTNDYYQSLIDWDDPGDPIRRLVIPMESELDGWGELDASNEGLYTKVPGLEHKYRDTALLLVNDVCGAYCRFCFRKRLFMDDNDEVVRDVTQGLAYIRRHPEISNVLLTGGDPLIMSASKLEPILRQLREIPHVKIIRIGTKMPAFNPQRIVGDEDLLKVIETHSSSEGRIYIMAHFNHPRELTAVARESLALLQKHGAITVNQTPLIAGVNDNTETLLELFNELSFMGVPPYYVFQCRPTEGNKEYSAPLEAGYRMFLKAQSQCSGLAKRARFCMSHLTGKIEVAALAKDIIVFKYHQAADPKNFGRVMIFERNPEAHWFDDYPESERYLTPPRMPVPKDLVFLETSAGRC